MEVNRRVRSLYYLACATWARPTATWDEDGFVSSSSRGRRPLSPVHPSGVTSFPFGSRNNRITAAYPIPRRGQGVSASRCLASDVQLVNELGVKGGRSLVEDEVRDAVLIGGLEGLVELEIGRVPMLVAFGEIELEDGDLSAPS